MEKIKRITSLRISLLTLLLILLGGMIINSGYCRDYRFTDAHLHYVNYVVQSQEFPNLLYEMDRSRIDRAVVFGLGYEISWPDARAYLVKYYMDPQTGTNYTPPVYFTKRGDYRLLMEYAELSTEQKARIYPFLQGINVSDRKEIYYVREMFVHHPELCGIGELSLREGALNRLTPLIPTGDSVALDPILDFAAANRMPVLIHQNLAEETPGLVSEPADPIYMKEITDLLTRHPDTVVIWAHTGIGRNVHVKDHLTVLKRLLAAHPNLYFDLSWFAWENSIEKDLESWADLIMSHPDRFVLGSDKIGNFRARKTEQSSHDRATTFSSHVSDSGVGDEMKKYIPLLQVLDQRRDGEAVSDMLAYRNMNWFLSRITGGCKTGKPVVDPWKGGDPWRDPRYARPVITAKLVGENALPISVYGNIAHLENDIRAKYYSWHKKHDYAGTVEGMTIPKPDPKRGVGLFAAPGFRNYIGFADITRTDSLQIQSLTLIENWDRAFGYKNEEIVFFPNGNWPTVPWWQDEAGTRGGIDKVRVPKGERLVLYADEYFRGKVLLTIPATNGKFEMLGDIATQVKSFQFLPEEKTPLTGH
ncbi:MAG: amidohydrolase family protein [Syntrophaceae bacterium]|nr:amidohydrolase family protein [Syntrophaceae bacterium]